MGDSRQKKQDDDSTKLRLKLAVARRVLAVLGSSAPAGYVDVSVPERPVAGAPKAQVAGSA